MKVNMGRIDQVLRIGISLVLIYLGFFEQQLIGDALSANIVAGIGIVSFFVAAMRFCPLYTLVGINTCPLKNKSQDS